MQLSEAQLELFQEVYKKKFGIDLTTKGGLKEGLFGNGICDTWNQTS